jgi:ribosomal protein S27AE
MNLRLDAPIWRDVDDLRCPSCGRVSWDRSDGGAVIALALGELVVLVDDEPGGSAQWVCGRCGATVEAGSVLEEELDVQAHGGRAAVDEWNRSG